MGNTQCQVKKLTRGRFQSEEKYGPRRHFWGGMPSYKRIIPLSTNFCNIRLPASPECVQTSGEMRGKGGKQCGSAGGRTAACRFCSYSKAEGGFRILPPQARVVAECGFLPVPRGKCGGGVTAKTRTRFRPSHVAFPASSRRLDKQRNCVTLEVNTEPTLGVVTDIGHEPPGSGA